MKKKFALLLVVTLVLTLMPLSASAASENRVTNVLQVAEDSSLIEGNTYLVISDTLGDIGTGRQIIQLTLTNAEWAPATNWNENMFRFYLDGSLITGGNSNSVAFVRQTNTRMDLQFTFDPADVGDDVNEIRIPIVATVTGTGNVTVTIDGLGSAVTSETLTVAYGVDAEVLITVGETVSFGPGEVGVLGNIVMDEAASGNLALTDRIRLTLPAGFEWAEDESFNVRGTGGFMGNVTADQDDYGAGTRDLEFTLQQVGITRQGSQRGTITLSNLAIYSDSNNFGEVTLSFGGDLDRVSFEAASFTDYDITVEADGDPETVIAGRFDGTGTDGFELATLIMEEEVVDSWIEGRSVEVEFPSWVKLTAVSGVTPTGFDPGDSAFTFTPSRTTSEERMEYEINIEAVVRADAEGDIVATISGRGLNRTFEVVLGEAVAPVMMETEVTELLIGQREHALNDIVIEETLGGGIMTGILEVDLGVGEWFRVPTVTVDEGDLEIGDVAIDGSTLTIEIERDSDTASVLLIEDAVLELSAQQAVGNYDLRIGGNALVTTNTSTYFEDDDYVAELPVLRAVTQLTVPASTVSFTVGQSYYFADGVRVDLDVAPYIKDARLMVPVAHVSRALGIPRDDVIWDGEARTVTVLVGTQVLQMTIGSQYLTVGGVQIDMEAAAEITADRTFVPISRFARAMNIDYTWNPETETVVFNQ